MYAVTLAQDADESAFRAAARPCLALGLSPGEVIFTTQPDSLFAAPPAAGPAIAINVPRAYAELMRDAVCHRAEDRFGLLYDVLWRIHAGDRDLASRASDAAVARLGDYGKAVRRDIHKMHAFVRFKERQADGRTTYVAWFEPQHWILRRATPFFADRFAGMEWLIATPIGTAGWRDGALTYGPAIPRPAGEEDQVLDEIWSTYFRTTFNPARLRLKAMTAEMPKHYWANMPETQHIAAMVREAPERVAAMAERPADVPPRFAAKARPAGRDETGPPAEGVDALRQEARACTRCPLYVPATQTVFGEGPADAPVIFVGEQPGDQEDLAGRPFVGPAGQMFDRALAQAGVDRARVYVTNAVKHFKFEPRGKRRLHMKPNAGEVAACRWWIEREVAALSPKLVVALGATAALSGTGRSVAVTKMRGQRLELYGHPGLMTVHPSYLLRIQDKEAAQAEFGRFVADLRLVADWVAEVRAAA